MRYIIHLKVHISILSRIYLSPLVWRYVLCLLLWDGYDKVHASRTVQYVNQISTTHQRSWLLLGYFHSTIHNGKRQYNKALGSRSAHSLGRQPERETVHYGGKIRQHFSWNPDKEKYAFQNGGIRLELEIFSWIMIFMWIYSICGELSVSVMVLKQQWWGR